MLPAFLYSFWCYFLSHISPSYAWVAFSEGAVAQVRALLRRCRALLLAGLWDIALSSSPLPD